GLPERPVPSLLRGFSAPVRLEASLSDDDLLVLFSHDSDPFNQWQAGQTLATRHIRAAMRGENLEAAFGKGLEHFLDQHAAQDPAFAAQVLALPSEADIARDIGRDINPTAIHEARLAVKRALGAELAPRLKALH